MNILIIEGFLKEIEKTAKKDLSATEAAGIGAATGLAGSYGYETGKQATRFRKIKKLPTTTNLGGFIKQLKPGDILMESDPHGMRTLKVRYVKKWKNIPGEKKDIINKLKRKIGKKKVKITNVIQAGAGGSPYHHAAVYVGNGKIFDIGGEENVAKFTKMTPKAYKKGRLVALRASENPEIQKKIVSEATKFKGKKYPERKEEIGRGLRRAFAPTGGCKIGKSGRIICTEIPTRAIKKATGKSLKRGVATRLVDPTDVITSRKLKPVAHFGDVKWTKAEKKLNIAGKLLRSAKWLPIGAGIGLGAYGAKKLYDMGVKRHWI